MSKPTSTYSVWQEYAKLFPKTSRYSLSLRIDNLFFEVIEFTNAVDIIYTAEKLPHIRRAITKLDTLKFFLHFAWKLYALDNKKYSGISESLTEVGKILEDWNKQLVEQDSSAVEEN